MSKEKTYLKWYNKVGYGSGDVFSVEDMAKVNAANVAANEDAVKEAAESCPVGAIVVE